MDYKSCYLLGHGVSIEDSLIRNCCQSTPTNSDTPILVKNYDPENIDWEEIFASKKKFREQQQTSELEECNGCYSLEARDWSKEKFISNINFNHWTNCNSKCIYCGTGKLPHSKNKNIYKSIKNLLAMGLFKNTGEITFQGGEPTILDEFEDLVNLFLEAKTKIRIHSSGILYSKTVAEGLKKGLVTIVISPDSGSKETYEKIKNVPCFENVCETVKKYSECLSDSTRHLVKLKYIIIPGYNDSIEEIDKWLDIVVKNNLKNIIVDIEYIYARHSINSISEHVYFLIDYIKQKAKDYNLEFETYDSAIYALKTRKIKEHKILIKNKGLYKLLIGVYKKKHKKKELNYLNLSFF